MEDQLKIKLLLAVIPAAVVLGCGASSHLPTSPATGINGQGAAGTVVGASTGASTAAPISGSDAYSTSTGSSRLVEIEGRVDSVTPPNLVVIDRRGARTVRTSIATRIEKDDRRISLSQVMPGDQVEVEGVLLSDGSLLAREIEVEGEDDEDEVEFTGTIESITGNVLVISGRTVVVTSSTVIKKNGQRIRVDQLLIGDRVEVEGTRLADGTILASELEVRDEDDEDDDDDEGEDEDDEDEDDEDDDQDQDDGDDDDDD